jgi:hypothetical protein
MIDVGTYPTICDRTDGASRKSKPQSDRLLEQAVKLVGQMKAAAEGKGDFSEIVMPNGRKLSECTFGYLSENGEAMEIMGLAAIRNF